LDLVENGGEQGNNRDASHFRCLMPKGGSRGSNMTCYQETIALLLTSTAA